MMQQTDQPGWVRAIGWVGLAAHLALFIWYAASGLVAPGWAVAVLLLVWAGFLALAIRLLVIRPLFVPLVPLTALLFWIMAISMGEAYLNWTP
jgi:hypothetical protein